MKYFKHSVKTALLLSSSLLAPATLLTPNMLLAEEVVLNENIEEIIVTVNRREQPLSEVNSSVSVLTANDLELGQYTYALDALQTLPGLSINQTGAFGGVASVRLRGASSGHTMVLIDGIQVNDTAAPGGAYDFSSLDAYGIERIEVLRGPQSILYGSDAIGGVINIISKIGRDGFGGQAFVEGGSFGTYRGGGNIFGGGETYGFNLSASRTTTSGISAADEEDGNTEKDGYDNFTLSAKARLSLSSAFEAELIARYSDSENDYDGFGPSDADNSLNTEEVLLAGRLRFNAFEDRLVQKLSLENTRLNRQDFSTWGETNTKGNRFNVDYLASFEARTDINLTVGAQHEESKFESVSPWSIQPSTGFDINSVFAETSYKSEGGLSLSAGLRYDDHETFGSATSGRITAAYHLEESGTRLLANWGEAFKAPTIFQLTFVGSEGANLTLKPEEADAWEVGVEQDILNGKIMLAATYFNQHTTNLITYVWPQGYINLDKSRSKGVELRLDAELTDKIHFKGNYTYTDAKDETTGEILISQPKDMAFGSLVWEAAPKVLGTLNIVYNGAETGYGDVPVDAWTRVDVKITMEAYEGIEVFGRIDNLFNKQYQQVSGFGTPGFSVFGGMKAKF